MFTLPAIKFKTDMTGLSRKVRVAYGKLSRPEELFEIFNSATDPDGVHYWKFVDEGTGPKEAGERPYMVFMVDGVLVKKASVAGNPAVNMLARSLPEFRDFLKSAMREIPLIGPNARPKDITLDWMDDVFRRSVIKLKELMIDLTPELDDQYFDPHPQFGTAAKGLLKGSYGVRDLKTGEVIGG